MSADGAEADMRTAGCGRMRLSIRAGRLAADASSAGERVEGPAMKPGKCGQVDGAASMDVGRLHRHCHRAVVRTVAAAGRQARVVAGLEHPRQGAEPEEQNQEGSKSSDASDFDGTRSVLQITS